MFEKFIMEMIKDVDPRPFPPGEDEGVEILGYVAEEMDIDLVRFFAFVEDRRNACNAELQELKTKNRTPEDSLRRSELMSEMGILKEMFWHEVNRRYNAWDKNLTCVTGTTGLAEIRAPAKPFGGMVIMGPFRMGGFPQQK